jgi:cation transport regulator ChaB
MASLQKMKEYITEDEVEHVLSLSSRNLYHYLMDTVIARYSDDEVRERYRETLLQEED